MNHPRPPLLPNRPLLRCEPKYGAVICLTCHNGYPLKPLSRHLQDHHHILKKDYGPIIQSLEREIHSQDWADLSYPINGSTLIEGLQFQNGYLCTGCGHRTINDQIAQKHKKCGAAVNRVLLQCWNTNGATEYWVATRLTQVTADRETGSSHSFILMLFVFDVLIYN
jgi:hypothetical protein